MCTNSFVQLHQTPKYESYMSTNICQVHSKRAKGSGITFVSPCHKITTGPTPVQSDSSHEQGILFGQKCKPFFLGPKTIKKETRIHGGVAMDRYTFPVKRTRYQ